jgi:hypothetical protein
MTMRACRREKEVAELVTCGRWPHACPDELRAHAEGCRACADLALVMQSLRAARSASAAAADPAPAGVVWWRAQLRRRKEAIEKIDRPILGAQILAFSSVAAIALVFAMFEARQGAQWLSRVGQLPHAVSDCVAGLWSAASAMPTWGLALSLAGLTAVAVFSGVVLYLDRQRQ